MLDISEQAFTAFTVHQRARALPAFVDKLARVISGGRGHELGIDPQIANDRQSLSNCIENAESAGLDGDRDIIAYYLLNHVHPQVLPIELAEWIEEIIAHDDYSWPEKLDTIHAILPENFRNLIFG